LRVAVVRNHGGLFEAPGLPLTADIIAFTADSTPWGAGAHLMYIPHGRHAACSFAGAKITSWAQNLTWNEEAHQRGFDEVVLLNENGQVSECTSANIFAVRGSEVWTPTLTGSGCLPGVTRAILLEEIKVPGLSIVERDFLPADLESADQAFITSTTRDLMPVLSVDRRPLTQNPEVLGRLSSAFQKFLESYVASHSREVVTQAGNLDSGSRKAASE
jgi:branched-chain amino acid aminotransferase